jgi:DNA-binding MurR/RpiR family transcriptional regulator
LHFVSEFAKLTYTMKNLNDEFITGFQTGMDYTALSKAIADGYPSLSPQLQLAARYVLDRPDDVALMSMRGLAGNAGVHPTTMVRLARRFDFGSFNDFRSLFQKRLRGHPSDYARRARDLQSRAGGPSDLVTEVMEKGLSNLRDSFEINGDDRFVAAATEILAGKRVFIAGLRSCYPVAFYFHYVYRVFRDNGILLHAQGGTFTDELRNFTKDDVLLAVSFEPYTKEIVAAVEYAQSRGGSAVVVTDSLVSPLARNAAHVLLIENESPSFFHSVAPALSAMEALMALMVARGGRKALEAITESEDQLDQFNAYWRTNQQAPSRQENREGAE